MEEEIENLDSPNEEGVESAKDEAQVEDIEALKEQNKKLFARAKKAEGFTLKEDGKWVKEPKKETKPEPKRENPEAKVQEGLTNKDILYFAKADIHEDDIDTVLEWSKFKNISVKEAHNELKAVLATKSEERRSAQATQIRGARGATASTAQDLISNARKGILSEKDEDIEALAMAEMALKIAESKR